MTIVEQFFALNHPAGAGHFPGNPIIPGALLLSETLRAIGHSLDVDLSRGQRVSAKFAHPARPGDNVSIDFSEIAGGTIKFACTVGGTKVMTGTICAAL
ncbi:MAG: hypothetical protein ABIS45_17200 [Burkholderiales bacterium]